MTLTQVDWAPLDQLTDTHNCRPPGCPGVHADLDRPCRPADFKCNCGRRWIRDGIGCSPAANAPRPNGRVTPKGARPDTKKKGRKR